MRILLMFLLLFKPCNSLEHRNLNALDVLTLDPNFSIFITLIHATQLAETIENSSQITIFAPNNDAFDTISWKEWLRPENITLLKNLLKDHIALQTGPIGNGIIETLNGTRMQILVEGDLITINQLNLVISNKTSSNGIAYCVNKVLILN